MAGGDWKVTPKELDEVYGSNKRTWVYRMVRAAQCLSEATLDALAENQIPNHRVHDNPHFVSAPAERQKLLAPNGQVAACHLAREEMQSATSKSSVNTRGSLRSSSRH